MISPPVSWGWASFANPLPPHPRLLIFVSHRVLLCYNATDYRTTSRCGAFGPPQRITAFAPLQNSSARRTGSMCRKRSSASGPYRKSTRVSSPTSLPSNIPTSLFVSNSCSANCSGVEPSKSSFAKWIRTACSSTRLGAGDVNLVLRKRSRTFKAYLRG